jgi:hypothetical protein
MVVQMVHDRLVCFSFDTKVLYLDKLHPEIYRGGYSRPSNINKMGDRLEHYSGIHVATWDCYLGRCGHNELNVCR